MVMRWLLVIGLAATAIGACTLFDEDPPDDSCKVDTDCFRAQGEYCNQNTHQCDLRDAAVMVTGVDAGVDSP